jgi:hypothetical protein
MSYSWRLKNVLEQIEMIENTLPIIFLIHNIEEPQTFSRFKKKTKKVSPYSETEIWKKMNYNANSIQYKLIEY